MLRNDKNTLYLLLKQETMYFKLHIIYFLILKVFWITVNTLNKNIFKIVVSKQAINKICLSVKKLSSGSAYWAKFFY